MRKHFFVGFGTGILIFLAVNLLMAHLASDCGLLAVFGRVGADDIVRAGWPLQFYEAGLLIATTSIGCSWSSTLRPESSSLSCSAGDTHETKTVPK